MKLIFKSTGERFKKSQNNTGRFLDPPQVYLHFARHAG